MLMHGNHKCIRRYYWKCSKIMMTTTLMVTMTMRNFENVIAAVNRNFIFAYIQ